MVQVIYNLYPLMERKIALRVRRPENYRAISFKIYSVFWLPVLFGFQ